jgi:hypothetical protein
VRSGPGAARTILLSHIISARPSKQPKKKPRGFGWCIHRGVEVTELSTNKQQHSLYQHTLGTGIPGAQSMNLYG